MKTPNFFTFAAFGAVMFAALLPALSIESPQSRADESGPGYGIFIRPGRAPGRDERQTEAPVGFDNRTNGFDVQGPDYSTLDRDNVIPLGSFNDNRFIFEDTETVQEGLGPTYNGQSCGECHQNVATGGASQVTEHLAGHGDHGVFRPSPGGAIVQSRATHPGIVERTDSEENVRTFRISTNILGDGFVESISNETLLAIRDSQPAEMRGIAIVVPVLEAGRAGSVGRFGWKSQHASLESFAADAYLNELGITTPLLPEENTSNGRFVGFGSNFDPVPEPEDDGTDVLALANFMRATKAPSRGPVPPAGVAGEKLFQETGCAICHVASIPTAPPGPTINGGAFTVPPALGNKIIHPYSDFLLHDVGTGDGIPALPASEFASTANLMRTAPLWALRTRNRLMHDGLSFTLEEAIERHGGQAARVTGRYHRLSEAQKELLLAFLNTL